MPRDANNKNSETAGVNDDRIFGMFVHTSFMVVMLKAERTFSRTLPIPPTFLVGKA